MTAVRIKIGDLVVRASLNDSNTAQRIKAALPFESKAQRWGDEVYFSVPVEAGKENAQEDVPSGTVAYWLAGKALCLFFGQKPYGAVNVVGVLEGDPTVLAATVEGQFVRVETA